jgi:hypothetical protein
MVVEYVSPEEKTVAIPQWDIELRTAGLRVTRNGVTATYKPCTAATVTGTDAVKTEGPFYIVALGGGLTQRQGKTTYYAVLELSPKGHPGIRQLWRLPVATQSWSCLPRAILASDSSGAFPWRFSAPRAPSWSRSHCALGCRST